MVSFIVGGGSPRRMRPRPRRGRRGRTESAAAFDRTAGPASARIETIGPFRVLSIGNRLGIGGCAKLRHFAVQENVMTIAVKMQGDQLEPKGGAAANADAVRRRQAGVLLTSEDEQRPMTE